MTPGDLRAEIARRQLVRYHLAADVGVHPARLGQMLLGKAPMPTEIAQKLTEAVESAAKMRGRVKRSRSSPPIAQ